MAYKTQIYEQGYDDRRFEGPIKEDLLCSICQCVLRNPRTCENKEHPFCLSCISQHLRNSHTCPECREPLTPKTLKDPPRFLKNTLSELNIKCDYAEQGCSAYVQLGNLQNHVQRCSFATVVCGNEGCGMMINKRDKEIHEKDFCQFRIPKCHDCKNMKASQDEIKKSQIAINVQIEKIERKQVEMEKNNNEIKDSQAQIKMELIEMKDKITRIERKQDQTMQSVDKIRWQFEKMMTMFQQLASQGNYANHNVAQTPAVPNNQQDIIILGGRYAVGARSVLKTVEKYNITEGKSALLPAMNLPRACSASCVYNGDVIIAGGLDGQSGTDLIEILNINQFPLRWMMFDVKLPVKLSDHTINVYQDKLYFTGGYNWNEGKTSDSIHELSLTPPCTVKPLTRMTLPRRNHRAEIVKNKLFLLGGTTTGFSKDCTDSVVAYDFINNETKPCPPLPKSVCFMSTVSWGNMIILVGGKDKFDQILNDVIMYDTETGRSERLPSLKHKRFAASAVIVHDVIIVLGGWNKEEGHLNSVECFTMGDYQWKELPEMKEKRNLATAVIKPRRY